MSSRRRKSKQSFRWVTALLFNALLLTTAWMAALLILENKRAIGEEYISSSEAVAATREKMGEMFADLVPETADRRQFWSEQIDEHLKEGDLTVAHGLLMAAPYMLDQQDADAVTAAANRSEVGRQDERLLEAAKLFLRDDVRARYERAVSPTIVETMSITATEEAENASTETDNADAADAPEPGENVPEDTSGTEPSPLSASAPPPQTLFVLGNERDLTYQSAGWIRGDKTDVFALSISGLGLASRDGRFETISISDDALRGASLVKSARRADRLTPEFAAYLEKRMNGALPEEDLKAELQTTFRNGNGSILIPSDVILDAFVRATDEGRLQLLLADLERIARLTEGRPDSAALIILETISSKNDLKRAELITFSGGDRAVALAKYYGSDALNSAQTVMDWSMRFIVLIMVCVALLLVLFWLALSTFLASFNRGDSLSRHYGYT